MEINSFMPTYTEHSIVQEISNLKRIATKQNDVLYKDKL